MNDQDATERSQTNGAASRAGEAGANSTEGLEVWVLTMMTNDELAAAIAYAFERCDQKYVGGYSTNTTEAGKVMLEHLKELLAVQRVRAGTVTTSNGEVRGASVTAQPACEASSREAATSTVVLEGSATGGND